MEIYVKRIKWNTATPEELLYTLKAITLEIQSRKDIVPNKEVNENGR